MWGNATGLGTLIPDPDSITEDSEWRLWAWESRPLARLQWDPREWHWRDPFTAADRPPVPFFQYSARLGRHILLAQRQVEPAAAEHWRRQGLTADFLTAFWQRIWSSQQARRTVTFQWLVAHRAIAVGTWLRFGGRPPDCSGCDHPQESQRHCLWDCPLAQQIWRRILRIFSYAGATQTFTWGAAAWGTLSGPALGYETAPDSLALLAQRGQLLSISVPDYSTATWTGEGDSRWEAS